MKQTGVSARHTFHTAAAWMTLLVVPSGLAGFAAEDPKGSSAKPKETRGAGVPAPEAQLSFTERMDSETHDLHEIARKSNFIKALRAGQGVLGEDQYTENLVQRFLIFQRCNDKITGSKDSKVIELYGKEIGNLFQKLTVDLEKLGISTKTLKVEKHALKETRDFLGYLEKEAKKSCVACIAPGYVAVGGAANGGPYIARALRAAFNNDIPVGYFSGSSEQELQSLRNRLDTLPAPEQQILIAATKQYYRSLTDICNTTQIRSKKH